MNHENVGNWSNGYYYCSYRPSVCITNWKKSVIFGSINIFFSSWALMWRVAFCSSDPVPQKFTDRPRAGVGCRGSLENTSEDSSLTKISSSLKTMVRFENLFFQSSRLKKQKFIWVIWVRTLPLWLLIFHRCDSSNFVDENGRMQVIKPPSVFLAPDYCFNSIPIRTWEKPLKFQLNSNIFVSKLTLISRRLFFSSIWLWANSLLLLISCLVVSAKPSFSLRLFSSESRSLSKVSSLLNWSEFLCQ